VCKGYNGAKEMTVSGYVWILSGFGDETDLTA
jgi:hypothetical protein